MRAKPRLATFPSQLIAGRDGAAAIEFALIFPVMFALFMGSIEITNLLMANLKTTAATEAASDLLAQTRATANATTKTGLDSYYVAAGMIMAPFPTTTSPTFPTAGLKVAFANITFNGAGTPSVAWHYEKNGAARITTAGLDTVTLRKLAGANDSVVMVQSTYVYNSPISFMLGTAYTFSDIAYNHPRYVPSVACTDCALGP